MASDQTPANSSTSDTAGVPNAISDERTRSVVDIVERLLSILRGRTISPRLKLLDIDAVSEATTLGKSTIDRMVREGDFPQPQRRLGKRLWRESRLISWMDQNDPN